MQKLYESAICEKYHYVLNGENAMSEILTVVRIKDILTTISIIPCIFYTQGSGKLHKQGGGIFEMCPLPYLGFFLHIIYDTPPR